MRSKRVKSVLAKIAGLPMFQALGLDVLEQAIRAHMGLKHGVESKKEFELACEKLRKLLRASVRELADDYGFTIEEVAALKKRPKEKVEATYRVERCIHNKLEALLEPLRRIRASREAVEGYLKFLRSEGLIGW